MLVPTRLPSGAPSEADLVAAARAGDTSAVGLLFARHRPALLAVATSLLGHGPDAEDAVQDAGLTALLRIGTLRDPGAVGPWLKEIVRNACRARLRAPAPLVLDDRVAADLPSSEPDPADLLDALAGRDWLWAALGELPPDQRVAFVLRYLGGLPAYRDIATTLGVPVGTVRSRLAAARARMAGALLATAETAHDDVAALTRARRREAVAALADADRGDARSMLAGRCSPAVESTWASGRTTTGPGHLRQIMAQDVDDGVRHRIADVVAGHDLELWEMELINPPEDPGHCPPGALWVLRLEGGEVRRTHLFHRPRRASAGPAAA
ncbi:DNA-directed RNA polymerase sigma-70 factor [Promicromonospora citrea]|uniref:DNA-directed RNA polymerase sigma-70 factor n=1 Tax=Promicromonospora citrea TaxID=43677 RepID=A0A8H9GF72_9MICO|nr:DNA-directed RNA polymerase sigma-70 factor [Promicromonospora citrea]